MNQGTNHQDNRYLPLFIAVGVCIGASFGGGLYAALKDPWALADGIIAGICLGFIAWAIKSKLHKRN